MDQPVDELLDEQSGPLPSQRSQPRGLGLIFQNHGESPQESPWSTEEPGEDSPPLDGGSPSASASSSGEDSAWSDEAPTSSPSASDAGPNPLSKKALKATFRNGVLIGSGVAHRLGARTEGQQQVGLYLADEDDAANIGDPLASIAARREGIAGKVSPDTADFISALMGVAGYMSKQIVRVQASRDIDAGGHTGIDPHGEA